MPAIAVSNVSYAVVKPLKHSDEGENLTRVDVSFGNGVLTYPANGIPLTRSSLNCKNTVTQLEIFAASPGDGFLYKYDPANFSIRIYQDSGGAAGPLVELGPAAAPAATTVRVAARGW